MQNNCYWNSQNPHLTHEVAFHSTEVDVLCAQSARRIVVPVPLNRTLFAKDMYK
jgi:virulence-associated protein VagC